jgi:hypothetical protein
MTFPERIPEFPELTASTKPLVLALIKQRQNSLFFRQKTRFRPKSDKPDNLFRTNLRAGERQGFAKWLRKCAPKPTRPEADAAGVGNFGQISAGRA